MNLNNCLKTLGIEETIDVDGLSNEIQEMQKQGLSPAESHKRAVGARVNKLTEERASIMGQIQPTTKAGGLSAGLSQKAQQDAIRSQQAASAQAPDRGPTSPESPATLQAGVDAIGRGGRLAAYSSDPKGFNDVEVPAGMVVVPSVDGGSYVTDQLRAPKIIEMDQNGQQAEILGYPKEKTADAEHVVQAKDAQGRTVQDVTSSDADLEETLLQGEQAAGEGGSLNVVTPEEALNERAGLTEGEQVETISGLAEREEAVEIAIKHNTTGRLMASIYGEGDISNVGGIRKVTMAPRDPKATQGDPVDNHPLVMKAVAKVFDDGKTEDRGRIFVRNPHSKDDTNTKVSMPAVIRLGRQLNRLNDVATNKKANMLTGLGHLYQLGFIPTKVRVKRDGKYKNFALGKADPEGGPSKLALPLDAVVDGHESNNTAVTFGQVMGRKDRPAEAAKKKLIDQYDKKIAQLKAMTTGTQAERNKATLRHKKNVKVLESEIAEIRKTLKDDFQHEVGDTKVGILPGFATPTSEQEATVTRGVKVTAGRKSGARSADVQDIASEAEDTTSTARKLETEEQQAKASAADVTPKAKPSVKYSALRSGKISQFSEHLSPKLVDMTAKVLKLLGIGTQVNIIDESGALHLIEQYKAELKTLKKNDERRLVLSHKIAKLEKILTDSPVGRIEYNDNFWHAPLAGKQKQIGDAADRVPTIFISRNNLKLTKQIRVLTHEIGHLVQRVALDQAPQEVQDAVRRSMAGVKASTSNRFEENFANMLWRYLMELDTKASVELDQQAFRLNPIARRVNRTDKVKQSDAAREKELKDLQLLSGFFKKLANKLRKLWSSMRKEYKLDQEYKEFVDSLVSISMERQGKTPRTRFGKKWTKVMQGYTNGPFMAYRTDVGPQGDNYTQEDIRALGNRVAQTRLGKKLLRETKGARAVLNMLNDKVLRAADAYLRAQKSPTLTKLANQFHHQPGLVKKTRAFFEEVRYNMGQRQVKMNEILKGLPLMEKKKGWWHRDEVDITSPEYIELMDKLTHGTSISEFRAMGGVVGETGVKVREYLEQQRVWLEQQGVNVDKRANYFPVVMNIHSWATEAAQKRVRAIFKQHGYTEEYANRVIEAVTKGDGFLADQLGNDDAMMGPSFGFMKKRKLSPELLTALMDSKDASGKNSELMLNNLQGILQFYTHSAVERGVTQKRWGLTSDEKVALKKEFGTLGIAEHINSPVAKLHYQLKKALDVGEITTDQYRTVKNRVLEGYFGRLGANLDPQWAKFQSMAIIYQNVRLLSLSTVSAWVDVGQVVWRADDARTAFKGMKTLMDKTKRQELYEMAHLIGSIQDDLTEHVLNDQTATQFMSPKAKQMNETFFRFIGMHQWTNMSRVMGLSVGKEFLINNGMRAAAGDKAAARHLAELGVTPQQIRDWQDSGFAVNDGAHADVVSALNTFIDEAVIRPDATTRPAWASDRHWQLLFHLKSFMWGYQEIILRRLWNRAANQPTLMKSLTQGGMSTMMLVAATLPIAIAGYEFRRKLSWWGNAPESSRKDGFEYMQEVAERAGYLGLFQFIADAEQASDFGKSSLLSIGGPTVTQLEEFFREDLVGFSSRAIPFLAQSGAARSYYRDFMRGELGE